MKNKINRQQAAGFSRQRGAAVLIIMVILASLAAIYAYTQFGSPDGRMLDQQDKRVEAVAQAKQALIAYAISQYDNGGRMGELPCPDYNNTGAEGAEDGNCGGTEKNKLGRLPWRSLGVEPLRDQAHQCLWYAVTGNYKHTPAARMLNDDSTGNFILSDAFANVLNGATPEDRAVAVIIAPGAALSGQQRTADPAAVSCGGGYTASDYLEGNGDIDNSDVQDVEDTLDRFIQASATSINAAPPFNDLFMVITEQDIWAEIKRRSDFLELMHSLTNSVASCLLNYANTPNSRHMPWPSAMDLAGNDYRDDASYVDQNMPADLYGRFPDDVGNSETELDNNGGGGGGGSVPPVCSDCWTAYQQALADAQAAYDARETAANADYQTCIQGRRNPRPCQNALTNELRDAQRDLDAARQAADNVYQACLAANSCPPGGGGGSCLDCQAIYDADLAAADATYQAAIDAAQQAYQDCRSNSRRGRGRCNRDYNRAVRSARRALRAAQSTALSNYNTCLANNVCTPTVTSKGISNLLTNGCLTAPELALWQDWKDHLFYAVSTPYAPDSTDTSCSGNCIRVDGRERAAVVIFSGQKTAAQLRNDAVAVDETGASAGDTDEKASIVNYLEGQDPVTGTYSSAAGNAANDKVINGLPVDENDLEADYMLCINPGANASDPLTEARCDAP